MPPAPHNQLKVALPPGDHRDDPTLTGAVRSSAERAAAEAMIAGLTGVRHITNDIQIHDNAGPL